MCRVSVIGGDTQVDMALPATAPVAAFVSDLVRLIDSRTPDVSERDDGPIKVRHWTLGRLGHEPIPPDQSLAEAGVLDGALLVLREVGDTDAPALFDDVIDAVARLTESAFPGWSPTSARWVALGLTLASACVAMVLLLSAKVHGMGIAAGASATVVGASALVAAVILARAARMATVSTVLSLCASWFAGLGAGLLVPGRIGSAHVLLGCAVALVVATLGYRTTQVGAAMFAAVCTVALFGGAAAAVRLVGHVPAAKIGAGVVVAALVLLSSVARVAMALARLPVPPVPTAGGVIDPADHEPRPTVEGIGAIGATSIPSAAGLAARARLANDYQTGVVIGAVIGAVCGAVTAADPVGPQHWQGVALAVVVGLILGLRGRAFADLVQAGTLIGSGCVTLVAVAAGAGLGHSAQPVPAAGALVALSVVALVIGVGGPAIDVSPVLRRAGELAEYALIVSVVPLTFWILDLYSVARGI
jgi:type VII secretion integral membrane protein EccD